MTVPKTSSFLLHDISIGITNRAPHLGDRYCTPTKIRNVDLCQDFKSLTTIYKIVEAAKLHARTMHLMNPHSPKLFSSHTFSFTSLITQNFNQPASHVLIKTLAFPNSTSFLQNDAFRKLTRNLVLFQHPKRSHETNNYLPCKRTTQEEKE